MYSTCIEIYAQAPGPAAAGRLSCMAAGVKGGPTLETLCYTPSGIMLYALSGSSMSCRVF